MKGHATPGCVLGATAMLMLMLPVPGGAAAGLPLSGVAEVATDQFGHAAGPAAPARVTVYFRGDDLRIEFDDDQGAHRALLAVRGAPVAWVMDGHAGAMPVANTPWPLRFDPGAPCDGLGMFADCQAIERGKVAGRDAVQWRYRLSSPRGPGRSSRGSMWLDAQTGFVLGYSADTGTGRPRQWRVEQVRYGTVPDALFDPPAMPVRSASAP